jgi:ubiquinone/menaquinone biosynthesis C-methylase UbiE
MGGFPLTNLDRVQKQWTSLGEKDPLWAILSVPDKKGGKWDQAAFFETGVREIEKVLETAGSVSTVRFDTAVDFGCGVGRLSQALAERFERVIGIDVAESMIEGARRLNRFPERCEYRHNAVSNLSTLGDESVDFIYSSITLQHVVPQLARLYIREFFRIARPGAHIVFQLPNRPRSPVWHSLKSALPVKLTNWLWQIRSGSPEAMESYFTPEKAVRAMVEQAQGSVAAAEVDQNGPPGWESRKYFCLKR